MRAGHLSIKIRDAKIAEVGSASETENEEVFCAAKIEDVGKLYTETRPMKEPISWEDEEELTFNCTPADPQGPPRTLQLMLYKQFSNSNEHQLLGMGSISLEGLEEGANKRDTEVPLVNAIGKNNGVIKATCHFFPSRCPGKSRDQLGREMLDPILVGKGSIEGAKELNTRSPKHSSRKSNRATASKNATTTTTTTTTITARAGEEKKYQPTGVEKGFPPEEMLPIG
jgi:hypothetical protein